MSAFTFTYQLLEHGCATATLRAEEQTLTMWVSYLSDALGELASALLLLLRAPEFDRVTCGWQDEPGEYRWIMQRQGDHVHLEIREFADNFSRQRDENGRLVFVWDGAQMRLATQIRGQMRQVLSAFGPEGYQARMRNYAFPQAELEQLTEWIRQNKPRRERRL